MACATSQLRLSQGTSNGAGGTAFITWYLTNTGDVLCTLYGYPGFAGLDRSGHIVQHPAERNATLAGNQRETTVRLRPGQQADFVVSSIDNVPTRGCSDTFAITDVQVYPPNQRTALRTHSREKSICNLRVGYVTQHRPVHR